MTAIKENQKELSTISTMLNGEKASVEALNDIVMRNHLVKNLRTRWDNMTMQEQQRALRICINRIIVSDDVVDIEYLI